MKKIGWYLKKIGHMNYHDFQKKLQEISKKTGKSKSLIFIDMIICSIRYGAGYVDYYEYEFFLLNNKQRKTYLTIGINKQLVERFNDKDHTYKLHDKGVFNEIFDKYLGRKWLDLEISALEDFENFLKNKDRIIVKPKCGFSGYDIEIINIDPNIKIEELYNQLKNNKQYIIEEVIENHPELKKLYDKSLNTLRIISFNNASKVFILARALKIGNGGVLDNFVAGGMYTFVDENGIVCAPAVDKFGNTHEEHPLTKMKFKGYQIPYFEETIALIKEVALIVPEVPYVGWDVAITKNGPVIIEGNQNSGIFQLKASLNPTKEGALPIYNQAMNFFKNKKI